MNNALILIIEDEPEIAEIIGTYMAREGFRVITAGDGSVGLAHHLRLRPDLVVLDIKLPGQDGYEVLAAIRRRGDTPVIMVTALAEDLDKLQALRIGADDYVVKPFNPLEVVARAKAVLRRTLGRGGDEALRAGPLTVDPLAHSAAVDTPAGPVTLDLTRTEFRILAHMAASPGRAFERAELVDACLPEGEALDRTVDSHVSNLRRKLISAGAGGCLPACGASAIAWTILMAGLMVGPMTRPVAGKLNSQIVRAMIALTLLAFAVVYFGLIAYFFFIYDWLYPEFTDEDFLRTGDIVTLGLLLGIGIASASLLGWFLARRIVAPLKSVAEAARQVAEGDFSARASVRRGNFGEAGDLVGDFNQMAERLQRAETELQYSNSAIAHELRTP
nr:response regulator [Marinicella sp. W31]MDC2880069.1 response regulator [Marinicella sp. W31]